MIFVNSMSDLFHEEVPIEFIRRVFDVMRQAPWHRFQMLTKRVGAPAVPEPPRLPWAPNIWMGVSVENDGLLLPHRRTCADTGAAVKFLSLEPLLGPLPASTWRASTGSSWAASPAPAPGRWTAPG